MKIRNDPLLKRIYFVLMITTANWLVGLLFMLKSTTLFQLEHLKSRSGRSADFAYKLRIHCLTKILNNWFELFDRLGLHSINMLHTVSPEKKSGGVRSGLLGGHTTEVLFEITLPLNFSFKTLKFWFVVWQVEPSCWNQSRFRSVNLLSLGQTLSFRRLR